MPQIQCNGPLPFPWIQAKVFFEFYAGENDVTTFWDAVLMTSLYPDFSSISRTVACIKGNPVSGEALSSAVLRNFSLGVDHHHHSSTGCHWTEAPQHGVVFAPTSGGPVFLSRLSAFAPAGCTIRSRVSEGRKTLHFSLYHWRTAQLEPFDDYLFLFILS